MKRILNHQDDFLKTISGFFNNPNMSDVILVVEGRRFYGHRFILGARSQYFKALLFGGLKETTESIIEMVNTPVRAFSCLLEYMYSGHLNLDRIISNRDDLIDLFSLSDRFGFEFLLESLSTESEHFLSLSNVIDLYEAAHFYSLQSLISKCLDFLDENSLHFLREENQDLSSSSSSLIRCSAASLRSILSRDTFWAPELLIFIGIEKWILQNQHQLTDEKKDVTSVIRLELIESEKLITRVKESSLFSWSVISDVINRKKEQLDLKNESETPDSQMFKPSVSRYGLVRDRNIFRKDLHVIPSSSGVNGESDMREREVARHDLRDSSSRILIGFQKPYLINMIRWRITATLLNPMTSPFPAYDAFSIDISSDGNNWTQCVEREQKQDIVLFWSERSFYFKPQVVQFIRIKGCVKRIRLESEKEYFFQLKQLEVYFTTNDFDFTPDHKALIPRFNCSQIPFMEDRTPKDDYFRADCDLQIKYKYPRSHKINTGKYIEFALEQMALVNFVKILLYDEDPDVSYSFLVESSPDDRNWTPLVDRRFIPCKSWQEISIQPTQIFFVRIRGTNVMNDVQNPNLFRLVHFECRYR